MSEQLLQNKFLIIMGRILEDRQLTIEGRSVYSYHQTVCGVMMVLNQTITSQPKHCYFQNTFTKFLPLYLKCMWCMLIHQHWIPRFSLVINIVVSLHKEGMGFTLNWLNNFSNLSLFVSYLIIKVTISSQSIRNHLTAVYFRWSFSSV